MVVLLLYSQKFNDPRIQLSADGLLAANGHNMQPWKIKLDTDKNVFYLFCDSERLSKEVDPFARQTMITRGIFLCIIICSYQIPIGRLTSRKWHAEEM